MQRLYQDKKKNFDRSKFRLNQDWINGYNCNKRVVFRNRLSPSTITQLTLDEAPVQLFSPWRQENPKISSPCHCLLDENLKLQQKEWTAALFLVFDCKMRWSSLHDIPSRYLTVSPMVTKQFTTEFQLANRLLSEAESAVIQEIVDLLREVQFTSTIIFKVYTDQSPCCS